MKKSGAQAVVNIMGIIGDIIGNGRDLRLAAGKAPKLQILMLLIRPDGKRNAALRDTRSLGLPSRHVSGPLCFTRPSSVSHERLRPSNPDNAARAL